MDLISILIPTYNEEENISELIGEIIKNLDLKNYDYEIIVIDNYSNDNTAEIVKKLILTNKKIKLIVNNRNYGHLRSPVWLNANKRRCFYFNKCRLSGPT